MNLTLQHLLTHKGIFTFPDGFTVPLDFKLLL